MKLLSWSVLQNVENLVLLCCLLFAFLPRSVDGSTVIAAKCTDGIVLMSDSVAGNTGGNPLISNRASKKMFRITANTLLCTPGGGGLASKDFQRLYDELHKTIQNHRCRYGSSLSTSAIARMTRQLVNTKYTRAHVIIAGWDSDDIKPDDVALEESLRGSAGTTLNKLEDAFNIRDNVYEMASTSSSNREMQYNCHSICVGACSGTRDVTIGTSTSTTCTDPVGTTSTSTSISKGTDLAGFSSKTRNYAQECEYVPVPCECEYVLCEVLPGGTLIEGESVLVAGTGAAVVAAYVADALEQLQSPAPPQERAQTQAKTRARAQRQSLMQRQRQVLWRVWQYCLCFLCFFVYVFFTSVIVVTERSERYLLIPFPSMMFLLYL
jgi:hypothetical protein